MAKERILRLRFNWVEDIEWILDKIEEISIPEDQFFPRRHLFNHCYVCGAFIIEHWFLVPRSEKDRKYFEEKKKDLHFSEVPFLICGNKCAPALLNDADLIKGEYIRREIQRQKRYDRNLKKYKKIVDICKCMMNELPDKNIYGQKAHKRLENIIYKCKVGSFSKYWLDKLNWIRKEYDLKDIEL